MYEDAKKELKSILEIVGQCPTALQEKCFEVLLKGYVDSHTGAATPKLPPAAPRVPDLPAAAGAQELQQVSLPESVGPRFRTAAKRLGVTLERLSALFDFTVEPFTFHALHVPGKNKAEKTRNVALLMAAKGYLAAGRWKGDWGEMKAMCVDQNCYDRNNMHNHLSHEYISSATADSGIALSSAGVKAAEALLASLSGAEGQ